jgi:hypothetical protein
VSRHEVIEGNYKLVFGWDQMLQSYFLQVHEMDLSEEENPVRWLGADPSSKMYEVEDLVRTTHKYTAYHISYGMQMILYRDKDEGR